MIMLFTQRLYDQKRCYSALMITMVMSTVLLLGCSANATEQGKENESVNTLKFKLDSCEEDYEDVNFCSDTFISEYTQAVANNQVNFNYQYLLHFIQSGYGFSEVVAIDPVTYHVIPLGVEIKPTSEVEFAIDSDSLCFSGEIAGYRQDNSYSRVCYTLQANPFIQNPESSGMAFVQSQSEF